MAKNLKKYLIQFALVFVLLTISAPVLAALELDYPVIPGFPDVNKDANQNIVSFLDYFFGVAMISAGFIGVMVIVYSGVKLLAAAGNPSAISEARERIFDCILGIILLMFSFVLLQTINPALVNQRNIPIERVDGVWILNGNRPSSINTGGSGLAVLLGNPFSIAIAHAQTSGISLDDFSDIDPAQTFDEDTTGDLEPGSFLFCGDDDQGSTLWVKTSSASNLIGATVHFISCVDADSIDETTDITNYSLSLNGVKSYERGYLTAGVYLFTGPRDTNGNCTGDMTGPITNSGQIPINFQNKVACAKIVNDARGPRYGFVLNQDPRALGTCSQPFMNFDEGDIHNPTNLGQAFSIASDGSEAGSVCDISSTPVCGNNTIEAGEQCDPANGTTCDPNCQTITSGGGNPVCGNSILEAGEQCDPANGTTCDSNCQTITSGGGNPACGDDNLDSGEQCDPPDGETCDLNCQTVTNNQTLGCTDPTADNYNSSATQDDGSCDYGTQGDELSCNPSYEYLPNLSYFGQPITFTAAGGSGNYSWSVTPSGNPSSGIGSTFLTSFNFTDCPRDENNELYGWSNCIPDVLVTDTDGATTYCAAEFDLSPSLTVTLNGATPSANYNLQYSNGGYIPAGDHLFGQRYIFPGWYIVNTGYGGSNAYIPNATYSGDCDSSGVIILYPGDIKTCNIITNTGGGGGGFCGDGIVNVASEQCDPPNGTTCDSSCQTITSGGGSGSGAVCGDNTCDAVSENGNNCPADCSGAVAIFKVNKVVVNNGGGGNKAVADFPLFVGISPVTSGVTYGFNPGPTTISETTSPNYVATFSGNCGNNGDINLIGGTDNGVCTITNTEKTANLTVIKTVINHGGNAGIFDFILSVDQTLVISGEAVTLHPGNYVISETAVDPSLNAYYTTYFSGACDALGNVTLNLNDDVICFITNEEDSDSPTYGYFPQFNFAATNIKSPILLASLTNFQLAALTGACGDGTCDDDEDATSCSQDCSPAVVLGCMDPTANNYNPSATSDDQSCTYDAPPSTTTCNDSGQCVEGGGGVSCTSDIGCATVSAPPDASDSCAPFSASYIYIIRGASPSDLVGIDSDSGYTGSGVNIYAGTKYVHFSPNDIKQQLSLDGTDFSDEHKTSKSYTNTDNLIKTEGQDQQGFAQDQNICAESYIYPCTQYIEPKGNYLSIIYTQNQQAPHNQTCHLIAGPVDWTRDTNSTPANTPPFNNPLSGPGSNLDMFKNNMEVFRVDILPIK